MAKQIKVTNKIYDDLTLLKTEDDTFSTVIQKILDENTRIRTENLELRTDKKNLMEILKKIKY